MPFSPASSSSLSNSGSAERTPLYSFNWAYEKVDTALRSHARAWEIFLPILGLSHRQLAFLLACNAPEWAVIRSIVHQIDRWVQKQARVGPGTPESQITTTLLLRCSGRILSMVSIPSLKDYLTARIQKFILQEQVKKGLSPTGESSLFSREELDACENQP